MRGRHTTNRAIVNNPIHIPTHKEQPDCLTLADHIAQTGECGVRHQEHDQADREALKGYQAGYMIERVW
jgi:hypothetical protein